MVAQHTDPRRLAASLQMDQILSVAFPDFLYLKQNLPRVITVDHSGVVKANSTLTKIQSRPKEMFHMVFLILFHSMKPRRT